MGDKDDGLFCQNSHDATGEDVAANVDVDSGEGVIEEIDVVVAVQGTGQADPLLLAPAEIDASLSNLRTQQNQTVD